jgi:hypothetical protein
MSKGQGQKIAIKFTQEILGDVSGNTAAFLVQGKQYKYVNGPLIDKAYIVTKIEPHPTEPNAILLTVDNLSRFPTVEGELTITYDASKGNLAGAGGAVESFARTFTPTDLIPEPNPGIQENITAQPTITVVINDIEYSKHYHTEPDHITAAPATVTVVITDVGIINP